MYHQYFGLKEPPFSIAPNPAYLFMSRRHKEALAHLLYGVSHGGGFVLLTGEVGTGKTTISRALLKRLPKNTDIAYILNPTLSTVELLATICDELKVEGITDATSLKDLSDHLHTFLLENHAHGRNTVLIIDEAQHLDYKVMEQIRLLTNLETDEKKLLQIVFIGQPELNELLAKNELRQLAQRITARFHIEPLTLQETQAYIRHRCMVAGMPASQSLFTSAAVKIIFKACSGIPRLINVTCDRALLGAYTHNSPKVDTDIAKSAVSEAATPTKINASRLPLVVGGVLATAIVVVLIWSLTRPTITPHQPAIAHNSATQNQGTIERRDTLPTEPEPIVNLKQQTAKQATQFSPQQPTQPPSWTTGQLIEQTYGLFNNAINTLQQTLAVFPGPLESPCQQLPSFSVECLEETLRSWDDLIDLNRPAILTLEVAGSNRYAVVINVDGQKQLQLLKSDGNTAQWPLFELGQYWTGKATLLWQPPNSYEEILKPGDRAPFVRWVAKSFAEIDGQTEPLARVHYNQALEQRVTLFQANNDLKPDGIVGVKTILKINDALNNDFGLLRKTQLGGEF